ncbi:MAG: hypothetical protein KBD77_04220 [Brachymonas sp.]|jgi:type IV pilus assembly protein PilX|nr:hypothetical protein [Brachymonas sp.]
MIRIQSKLPIRSASMHRQQGLSLFTILVMLLLTMLLVLGALRLSLFNEGVIGNQADAQRAYASAEALLRNAEADIRANGLNCSVSLASCRFPRDMDDFMAMALVRRGACSNNTNEKGVCFPETPDDRIFQADYIMAKPAGQTADPVMNLNTAASYTAFASAATTGDADLSLTAAKGQYWVEVFVYNVATSARFDSSIYPVPDPVYPFIFRITARAEGLRPGTVSTLRTFYVPYPRKPI